MDLREEVHGVEYSKDYKQQHLIKRVLGQGLAIGGKGSRGYAQRKEQSRSARGNCTTAVAATSVSRGARVWSWLSLRLECSLPGVQPAFHISAVQRAHSAAGLTCPLASTPLARRASTRPTSSGQLDQL